MSSSLSDTGRTSQLVRSRRSWRWRVTKRGYKKSFQGYGLPTQLDALLNLAEQRAGGDRRAETKGQATRNAAQGGFKKWQKCRTTGTSISNIHSTGTIQCYGHIRFLRGREE